MPNIKDGLYTLGHLHTETWHCDTCNLDIQAEGRQHHENSNRHKLNEKYGRDGHIWYCDVCRRSIQFYGRNGHLKTKKHLLNSFKEGWSI